MRDPRGHARWVKPPRNYSRLTETSPPWIPGLVLLMRGLCAELRGRIVAFGYSRRQTLNLHAIRVS